MHLVVDNDHWPLKAAAFAEARPEDQVDFILKPALVEKLLA